MSEAEFLEQITKIAAQLKRIADCMEATSKRSEEDRATAYKVVNEFSKRAQEVIDQIDDEGEEWKPY